MLLADSGATPTPNSGPTGTGPSDTGFVWVVMKQQADLEGMRTRAPRDWMGRGSSVVGELHRTADSSQAPVKELLTQRGANFEPYWIVNALRVKADPATLEELARHPGVARVFPDTVFVIPEPVRGSPVPSVDGLEWGIADIRAGETWDRFGVRGEGIVVANLDTGVQFDHPALLKQYRGNTAGGYDHNYNWYDPSNVCGSPSTVPCDNEGHGTHTMGTMVGESASDQIGVAPRATWIAAKGCETYSCSSSALLSSAQWLLAPTDLKGENPRPDLRPNIINNSWGGGSGDTFFESVVQAWVAAGIFPVFSSGNSGPSCGSAGSPGDYPETYSAGAYDVSRNIASWSSRGPSYFGLGKPNLAGPGVSVRSSIPGGGYDSFSGTSMAAPHLSGTVALMWSAAPALVGDIGATRALLDLAAVDVEDTSCGGDARNNNVWGEGRLDAYAATELAPVGPTGMLAGIVRSAADGSAIANARVVVPVSAAYTREVRTGSDGSYQVRLAVGTYSVSVEAFAYEPASVSGVVIEEGATTTQDFALALRPAHAVSGTVRDSAGSPLAGVAVALVDTPLPAAYTDELGQYRIPSVPEGRYEARVTGNRCYDPSSASLDVSAPVVLDFVLTNRSDAYGYRCVPAAYGYVRATEPLLTTGDNESAVLKLPFPFIYYGVSYQQVTVSVNGEVHFVPGDDYGYNTPIPDPGLPNAAIYALWDNLYLDGQGSIQSEVLGSAPNRRVVVEWRDLRSYDLPDARLSFELVLHEDGQIEQQYQSPPGDPAYYGAAATIGIEDAQGSDGLQYSYNESSVLAGSGLRFFLPPSGVIQGTVTDQNDGLPIAGASVVASTGQTSVRKTKTDAEGKYLLQVPVGVYEVEVTANRYAGEHRRFSVAENQVLPADFALKTPRATLTPDTLEFVVPVGAVRTRTLQLRNTGSAALEWVLRESGSARPSGLSGTSGVAGPVRTGLDRPDSIDTRDLYGARPAVREIAPQAVGDVLASFPAVGLQSVWGLGYTGNLWLSESYNRRNFEFAVDGTPTGRSYFADWAAYFAADMAFDSNQGLMCQVNSGGTNGIYCWDVDTGMVKSSIVGSLPWTYYSQRGLAYREDDDTFYIGGWEGTLYHIRGLSYGDPGAVIGSCRPPSPDIAGLAYNGSAQVLWQATNNSADTIYGLNPEDCSVIATVPHPMPGYSGAGLDMDAFGNLWVASQRNNSVYLVESGVPSFSDVPWLAASVTSGTLAPGEQQAIEVEIDATGLVPGVYLGSLFVQSNAGRTPTLRVPIKLVVSSYQQALNAGGPSYVDHNGEPWGADRAYKPGSFGYVQNSYAYVSHHAIAKTDDPALYQSVRVDPYGYRFDNVPNGVYQVELRFAQLRDLNLGDRMFDVIIENTDALPAHDIAYEVGSYVADAHEFFVEVVDGQLDIRLVAFDGPPIINALRVTHRPDGRAAEQSSKRAPRCTGTPCNAASDGGVRQPAPPTVQLAQVPQ